MNKTPKRILITGFSPFDGRKQNASLIAATAAKDAHDSIISLLEIPVEWGLPRKVLAEAIELSQPDIIISLGEGHVGEFNIETEAKNIRKERLDNEGNLPLGPNYSDGPDTMKATINAETLIRLLNPKNDIPINISSDAGGFICEETLYTLETLKNLSPTISMVVFVHLPPYGSELVYQHQRRKCDESLLSDFTTRLIDGILNLADISLTYR